MSDPVDGGLPEENVNPAPAAQAVGGIQEGVPECVICIEPCVHPVELPCKHIFCFLCIKGVTVQAHQHAMTPKCSICRREIPAYVLTHPRLLEPAQLYRTPPSSEYQWFYEARGGGWWQFEERLMVDLERAYTAQQTSCQLLIAGQMYEVDFQQMIQYRAGHGNLARRIKRDLASAQRKGIAGIRMGANGEAGSSSSASGGQGSAVSGSFFGPSSYGNAAQNGPTSSQDSVTETESDEEADGFSSSDENDEVELVQEEESEEDSDEEDGDLIEDSPDCVRDGARAPTSRSDRSTSSSNTNHTPPPLSGPKGANSSAKGCSRTALTTPTSSATPPNADGSSGNSNGPTPSPTHHRPSANSTQRPTVIVVSPTVRLTLDENSMQTADEVL